ncbi:MAG: VTT domain-containing protein [Anaerolineales bacterium]
MLNNFLLSLSSATTAQHPLAGWVYVLLAILVAIEGPIATLTGAFAASSGLLNPALVFASASLGNLTADTLWYSLGYLGKTEWVMKLSSRFGVKENVITNLQRDVREHIHKVLFIAKLTMGLVIPALVAAGLARVPFKRWFGVLFGAECIWTGSLVLAGYYFGTFTQRIESNLRWLSLAGALLLTGIVIVYISRLRQRTEEI